MAIVDFNLITGTTPFYVYVVTLDKNGTSNILLDDILTVTSLVYQPPTFNQIIPNSQSDGFADQSWATAVGSNTSNLQLDYAADNLSGFAVKGPANTYYYYSNVPLNIGSTIPVNPDGPWDPNAVCFLRGTLLETPDGEVAVEDLKVGDLLLTHGSGALPISWVGCRTYALPFGTRQRETMPVCIHAGALGGGLPTRDLWVSPRHCFLVDGALIPADRMINGVSIEQPLPTQAIEYFHFEFDRHECVRAAGTWSESFLDNGNRFRFHNAHEHDGVVRGSAIPFPAPQLEQGLELANRLVAIRAHAGLADKAGPMIGAVESVATDRVIGWAFDAGNPDLPVILDVVLDGVLVTSAVACDYRKDVQQAGFGLGVAGFNVTLPEGQVTDADLPRLEVRRRIDGAPLREMAAQRLSA